MHKIAPATPDADLEQAKRPKEWSAWTYRAGLSVFASAFVGVAIAITTGDQTLVIAFITAAAAGGVVAAFELCRMMRNDLRLFSGEESHDDDDDGGGGGGGGGWGRPTEPEVTPPQPEGLLPELDEPAWWPAFELALNNWVPDTSDASGA